MSEERGAVGRKGAQRAGWELGRTGALVMRWWGQRVRGKDGAAGKAARLAEGGAAVKKNKRLVEQREGAGR